MSDVRPYVTGSTSALASRRVATSLRDVATRTTTDLARIEAAADVQAARVDALAHVSGRALQSVALVTQLEQQLSQVVPLATGRLQAIGDMAALATAGVVADTAGRLRRC